MNNPYVEIAVGCLNVHEVPFQWLVQSLSYLTSVGREIRREKGALVLTPFDKNVLDMKPLTIRVANENRGEMTFIPERLVSA
jgi:hypothetical protein